MGDIYVKVETGSSEFRVENGLYPRVYLTEEAENGRANAELVKRLAEILGKRPGIVSGQTSSRKKLAVDLPEDDIRRKLGAEADG